jgi:sugar/nucleoside kinase (ribokinase family)
LPADHVNTQRGQAPPTQIVCVGMAVVDVLAQGVSAMPGAGQTVSVPSVTVVPGGDAVNQSVTLAALGNSVGLMTVVGSDWQGSLIAGYWRDRGVDVRGVAVTTDYATTTSIVLIDEAGERSFISPQGGTAAMFGIAHADPDSLQPGLKALSVASMFCSRSLDEDLLPPLLARARELGAITIADLVHDRADGSLDQMAGVLAQLDYVIPSLAEAEFFTGTADPAAAAETFRKYGTRNVIIKLGRDGSYALTPEGAVHVPAFDVPAVDTTGAGDSFVAGLLSGLVLGQQLEEALRRGSATAALSVQAIGATSGVRDSGQLDEALRTLPVRRPGQQFPVRQPLEAP